MLREFFDYADELRGKGLYDITEIGNGFYRNELKEYPKENVDKASLSLKKFAKLTRHFGD